MNWLLIINDTECKPALERFLKNYSGSLLYKKEVDVLMDSFELLSQNINMALNQKARISLNSASTITVLKVDDIIRCESHRSYTEVYFLEGKLTLSKTLKQFEKELAPFSFIRIHQSHLVNLNYIDKFIKNKGGFLVLKDKTELPVAIRKKESLLKVLEDLNK